MADNLSSITVSQVDIHEEIFSDENNAFNANQLQAMLAHASTVIHNEKDNSKRDVVSNFDGTGPDVCNDSNSEQSLYSHLVNYFQAPQCVESVPSNTLPSETEIPVETSLTLAENSVNNSIVSSPVAEAVKPAAVAQPPPVISQSIARPNASSSSFSNYSLTASVHVHVEGISFQYQLTEDDLTNVFSRYGPVRLVQVNFDGSSAIVHFFNPADTCKAIADLDGKVLNGVSGSLRVIPISVAASHAMGLNSSPLSMASTAAASSSLPGTPFIASSNSSAINQAMMYQQQDFASRAVRKYTARFEIGIENDRDFHIARRIIGPKGAHMKKIVLNAEGVETPKLRLRGMGSGFLEGALKQESPEPLHLCVSCKDYKNYRMAAHEVSVLLDNVYRDYAEYLRSKGRLDLPVPMVTVKEHHLLSHPFGQAVNSPTSSVAEIISGGFGSFPASTLPPNTSNIHSSWSMTGGLTFPVDIAPNSPNLPPTNSNIKWNPNVPEWRPAGQIYAETRKVINPSEKCVSSTSSPSSSSSACAGVELEYNEVDDSLVSSNLPCVSFDDQVTITDIERLIEQRNEARRVCNFREADRIRDILRIKGIGLIDEPGGRGTGAEVTSWRFWRNK